MQTSRTNGHAGNGASFTSLRDPAPPRIVPAADQLEQHLLAALLFDNSRLDNVGALGPEHFGRDVHARIFELMRRLVSHGIPAKPQTLQHLIAGEPTLPGLPHYLDDLARSVVTALPAAVSYYADEIIAAAFVRQYVATANDLCDAALRNPPREGWRRFAEAIVGEHRELVHKVASYDQLQALDFATLPDDPVVKRPWLVPQWFPMLETIGIGGPGGEGKTLLAHQLATSAAIGKSWFGLSVEPMKAALLLCEDRANDAHWRQADINRDLGCTMRDLAGRLKVYPRRDAATNKLGVFDDHNHLHLTPLFFELIADLRAFGARAVFLDTRSDVFLGQQNNEEHARSFVRQVCDRIARELDGVTFLLYQPSKAGMSDRTGMSGSVQWDAAFRARVMLGRPPDDDDDDDDGGRVRLIELMKSNYSASGAQLEVRWQNGVFVRDAPDDKPLYERAAEHSAAERIWHQQFAVLTRLRRPLSPLEMSPYYAPRQIAKENRLTKGSPKCSERELETVMKELLARGEYRVEEVGPPSRTITKIVKVENGV